jgi:hypothetical protein
MKQIHGVTFLAVTVLTLVSNLFSIAEAATSTLPAPVFKAQLYKTNSTVMSADQVVKREEAPEPSAFNASVLVSRNTSLIDYKDGSRKDGIDYLFVPGVKTYFGSFSTKLAYSKNLRETDTTADDKSDWADAPVTFAMNPKKWLWSPPYVITVTPTLTAVVPLSQVSIKRDQLQTAIIGGLSFGIIPDGIFIKKDGAWNLAIGVTAGRNFHSYEENIVGTVLNKYSSNQTLNLGYAYKDVSFGVEYIHKARWTYQGNMKEAFELTEELGYSFNEKFSVAVGHTNAGAGLRANGMDSNIEVINENDSVVYVSMGFSI